MRKDKIYKVHLVDRWSSGITYCGRELETNHIIATNYQPHCTCTNCLRNRKKWEDIDEQL